MSLSAEMPIENTIAIRYNKNYPVVMANKLIRARKDRLTTFEAKLLRLAISNIVELDTDLKTYTVSIADLADFLGIDSSNVYREVPQIAKSLFDKDIYIHTGYDKKGNQTFKMFHWVDFIEYKDGTITLKLSESLKPYLLGLDSLFTKYGYDTVLALPKETAIIMYELLISFEGLRIYDITLETYPDIELQSGEFVLSIDFLREYFDCKDRYPNTSDFIKWVIDYNLNIIMTHTLARIKYRTVKKGRSIQYIVFRFVGLFEDRQLETEIKKLRLKAGLPNEY